MAQLDVNPPPLAAPSQPAVRLRGLGHRYPGATRPALQEVSFDIGAGEVFAIVGPNGGGKTTLFRILATLLRPTQGDVDVFGVSLSTDGAAARRLLGVVFQSPSLDGQLTALENLVHGGHLYGLRGAALRRRSAEVLERFGLAEHAGVCARHLSGGQRRRLELARALLHQPSVLLLDEPSTGLDPAIRAEWWRHLAALRAGFGVTVVLTTHFLDEAQRADRVAILDRGRLLALDTPAALRAAEAGDVVVIEPAEGLGAPALVRQLDQRFAPWPAGGAPQLVDGRIHCRRPDAPRFVAELAAALPGSFHQVTLGRPGLQEAFLRLTGRSLDA